VSILLALAAVTMIVKKSGPTSLMQLGPLRVDNVEIHHLEAPFTNLANKAKSVVYYYVPPAKHAAKLSQSKLQHMAASANMLAAPAPGSFVAPSVGDGPTCDLWNLQTLSDNTQLAWDKCMSNKNYKEPNSIAQEIYDELDATEEGEVTPQEYCAVARKHTARLTDEQCKEIIKLMDEAAGNGDGVLSFSEFKAAYLKGQEPPAAEEEEERRRRRHLLSWVWVPGHGEEPKAEKIPGNGEVFYTSSLATFKRIAVDMATCKTLALGDVCEQVGKCPEPVCAGDTMYNDTKVESLCGMCVLAGEQSEAGASGGGLGCFALDAMVGVEGRGAVAVADIAAGDKIVATGPDGSPEYSRVVFTHAHVDAMPTVRLAVAGDVMELTEAHQVPVYTEECGSSYCAAAKLVKARQVAAGDRLYVSDGERSTAQTVLTTSAGTAHVKYIVTEAGNLVVNGVVASVFSTMAKHLETLPFYTLDSLFPGIFEWSPVKAALYSVLESPALQRAELVVDMVASSKTAVMMPQRAAAFGFAAGSV